MSSESIPVLTIDGPAGSGKGTICQMFARQAGWHYLDSGAIYRVLAYTALEQQVDLEDEPRLVELASALDMAFKPQASGVVVLSAGADITDAIRAERVSVAASQVSKWSKVRDALLQRQRGFRQAPGLATDGRDMGTVVFPDANLKIFMTASVEARAVRRVEQLLSKGINVNLADVQADLVARDKRDSEREVAPLKPALDAVVIDTTAMSIETVLEQVSELYQERVVS